MMVPHVPIKKKRCTPRVPDRPVTGAAFAAIGSFSIFTSPSIMSPNQHKPLFAPVSLDLLDVPQKEATYQVVWREGYLGIAFVDSFDCVVVSRTTGKGHSIGVERVHMGDVLLSVNNIDTQGWSLAATRKLLQTVPLPAILHFAKGDLAPFMTFHAETQTHKAARLAFTPPCYQVCDEAAMTSPRHERSTSKSLTFHPAAKWTSSPVHNARLSSSF
ncbi:Aste57867_8497 [Aphanomyces stellatus]|uniref:Aste57867_8497 protein n=1 Tax=Aphanomyces stellatus TaxID=120398 RepID=A0A485KKL9_9STRA|nr:hypothetical protein As57867_008465 [Aphanomyces stellatus]VFT85383.1 Aste57867_8497 [Aphanomyces stellatus]